MVDNAEDIESNAVEVCWNGNMNMGFGSTVPAALFQE